MLPNGLIFLIIEFKQFDWLRVMQSFYTGSLLTVHQSLIGPIGVDNIISPYWYCTITIRKIGNNFVYFWYVVEILINSFFVIIYIFNNSQSDLISNIPCKTCPISLQYKNQIQHGVVFHFTFKICFKLKEYWLAFVEVLAML